MIFGQIAWLFSVILENLVVSASQNAFDDYRLIEDLYLFSVIFIRTDGFCCSFS